MRTSFVDDDSLRLLASLPEPPDSLFESIIARSGELNGLTLREAAHLLACRSPARINDLLDAAAGAKEAIYGRRLVVFAPLYTGNVCNNDCTYCGFRKSNPDIQRRVLSPEEVRSEAEVLAAQGHKRVLLIGGEAGPGHLGHTIDCIRAVYSARSAEGGGIRRVNLEIAPQDADGFSRIRDEGIGTYVLFQETYDREIYSAAHPSGPKADFDYRLSAMDRAMAAGIDDVGIGVLYGLADHRFDTLAMIAHAAHLEQTFGVGPHTVSVPRIEPAAGAPLSSAPPNPVDDLEFCKIVSVLRLTLPYTGIILSTREQPQLRRKLFKFGVSQISAGSKTNPGAYAEASSTGSRSLPRSPAATAQFSLGDHRDLDTVVGEMASMGFIPSFCTGCYRAGRTGHDFMDLAKPGLIREYCEPNAILTFREYIEDYASPETANTGLSLISRLLHEMDPRQRQPLEEKLSAIEGGVRDIYS